MTTLKRIIRSGFVKFWRNGFLSLSSVVVMMITLFVIGSLIFLGAMLESALATLQDKVDVNVYFVTTAEEEDILAIKNRLEARSEVDRVEYISREEALARFQARHANDAVELQALQELGENPLRASLAVKATNPSYYEDIDLFLKEDNAALSQDGEPIIAKVNFDDNRDAIERLSEIIAVMDKVGLAVTVIVVAASILIVFNTTRLIIYTARDEIAVMRLVGASYAYIRGPFVVEGMLSGLLAALLTTAVFYPLTLWLGPGTERFFGTFNLFAYFTSHAGEILLTMVLSGVLLGAVSSFLAVKRYLKV